MKNRERRTHAYVCIACTYTTSNLSTTQKKKYNWNIHTNICKHVYMEEVGGEEIFEIR